MRLTEQFRVLHTNPDGSVSEVVTASSRGPVAEFLAEPVYVVQRRQVIYGEWETVDEYADDEETP